MSSERLSDSVEASLRDGGFGRLLSDAPISPDVWRAFAGVTADTRTRVLITPVNDVSAATVAAALPDASGPVHIPGLVSAFVTLNELVSEVLPLTRWWCSLPAIEFPSRREVAIRRIAAIVTAFEADIALPAAASGGGLIERVALERKFDLATCQAPAPLAAINPGDANRTIRADAAIRLFQPNCSHIRWAVVDAGVDARCGAFGLAADAPADLGESELGRCRVKAVYDFANLGGLLAAATNAERGPARSSGSTDHPKAKLAAIRRRLKDGLDIDWEMLMPLLERRVGSAPPADETGAPADHGTAVAGLLAGDGQTGGVLGVCPDIHILDVRVVAPGSSQVSEFDLIAALKFLRFLYGRNERPGVHGINLSLQTHHNVRDYACGATPVCEEVNRAADAGLVVVAAAGNLGYRVLEDVDGVSAPHYFAMTIADPGNAEGAITVGSTHRRDPYRYGVSFFSGRGPTGDGRMKPDIVAPGEKIVVLTATGGIEDKDGTSYAAPMVSGAAAMLMARNPELIGRPREVKRVLMATASDLGRKREFQGAGLLDVLRAMQWGGRGDVD